MAPPALALVRMDVAHDHEAGSGRLDDTGHTVSFGAAPRVRRFSRRSRGPLATDPGNRAAYAANLADLPMSSEGNAGSDIGRRKPKVRPCTHTKRQIVSERIWPAARRAA